MAFFLPNDYKETYLEYTPKYLSSLGKKALLCDIDNTLVTYDDPVPTEALCKWLSEMKAAGITVGFISNNSKERVERFNESLGLFAVPKACKPLGGGMRRFMRETGFQRKEIAHLGDQIFTDTYAAKRLGMRAYTVPPIRDKRDPFTRFKRLLERPVYRAYRRRTEEEKEKN